MEEDDLPRSQSRPREASLAGSLGEVFGAMVWIVAIFAIVAGVLHILIARL
jgi:hypothetical protein